MAVNERSMLRHATATRRSGLFNAAARRTVLALAARGRGGEIELTERGRVHRLGAGELQARITVVDPAAYAAVLTAASVGLGSSYVAGWWESDDLTALVRVLYRDTGSLRAGLDRLGRTWGGLLESPARRVAPGPDDDRRNVSDHYDLSNEFYALMLDETMTYSCALFDGPGTTLAEAQRAKIDRLCVKLELGPDDHLLEIGSGWGGLALRAAARYGARVTTTTVSDAQRRYVEKRVADAGLADRITVLGQDWRDLRGQFDKLVSVEMIEAVDWRWHDRFLAACSDRLAEGGRAAIQAIVIDDRSFERAKHHDDFVRRMVFPGGCLPSVASLTASVARTTDLVVVDLEDLGDHYAETLRRWQQNLGDHATEVDALGTDRSFLRLWALYLAYCEAAFMERHITDVQVLLAKPHRPPRLGRRPI